MMSSVHLFVHSGIESIINQERGGKNTHTQIESVQMQWLILFVKIGNILSMLTIFVLTEIPPLRPRPRGYSVQSQYA